MRPTAPDLSAAPRVALVAVAAAAALLASLVAPAPAQAQLMPGYEDLARTTALTAADDYRIGKGYMDMMSWMVGLEEDPELVTRMEQMTRALVAASDRPDMVFNIVVTSSPEINASALPGGFMMVNRGLIDALAPEELAFVVAHEISHVQLRHFATTMNVSKAMEVLNAGETAQGSEDRAQVEEATESLSKMATSYARKLELEADLYGMLYAARAGYPMSSGVAAMGHMRDIVGEVPEWLSEVSSHPTFSQRIAELEQGLQTIEETHGLFDAGVSYARAGAYDAAIPAFQQFLTLFPKSSAAWSNLGTCYLKQAIQKSPDADPWVDDLPLYTQADVQVRADAKLDRTLLERARSALGKALAIDPNRDAAIANLGVMARLEGDDKSAEELLKKALELDGDYAGYINNLANVHAGKKDWKAAEKGYRKALKKDRNAGYAKVNLAGLLMNQGGKKGKNEALALWRELESSTRYGAKARAALLAAGETPAEVAPVARVEEADQTLLVALMERLEELEGQVDGGTLGGGTAEPVEAQAEPAPEPVPVETGGATGADTAVGSVALGKNLAAFKAALGTPDYEDGQEDGYYAFASWVSAGLSAVFLDDAATSVEVFEPGQTKSARGVACGSTKDAVVTAYGEPSDQWGDISDGYEVLNYEAVGHAFYIGAEGTVSGFSLWTY